MLTPLCVVVGIIIALSLFLLLPSLLSLLLFGVIIALSSPSLLGFRPPTIEQSDHQ
jgi:hypothetical protein